MLSPSVEKELRLAAEEGHGVSDQAALAVLRSGREDMPDLLAVAARVRRRFFGERLHHCSILNAKSGACSEDCAFCAQSAHHRTGAEVFSLRSVEEMRAARDEVAGLPVERFGIVTSGEALDDEGVNRIAEAMRGSSPAGASWCASLGCLRSDQLLELRRAGMKRYHHNLETAASYFPSICSTHAYADRLATLRAARAAGLETCCGGILGLGESLEQRVEFARTLAVEKIDSIPLNFLVPVPGTRMESVAPMKPLDILRSIIMFRLVNPRAEVRVCAGRLHLRDLQSMIFYAGATGMMIGRLLTVAGRDVAVDTQMLADLEFDS